MEAQDKDRMLDICLRLNATESILAESLEELRKAEKTVREIIIKEVNKNA